MTIPLITAMENRFLIGAHAIIINDKKELLVIRRSQKNDFMSLKWDLPGGTVEPGEEVKAALCREIKEELSTTVTVGDPFDVYDTFENGIHCVQILFLCHIPKDAQIKLNPGEHDSFLWVNSATLKNLDKIGFLENVQPKIDEIL